MSTRPIRYEWFDRLLDMPEDDPANDGIDAYAIAVAAALISHMDSNGLCWPSIRLLAAETRCSANVVQDRITRLERNGLLVVERHRRSANRYQATVSRDDTDGRRRGSVSSERRSVSSERASVSSERRSVSSERSSVSPGDTEQGNPRRGEPVNPAPFGGALPKGRAPFGGGGRDDTGHKLAGIVKEIVWKLDNHDEELGLPDNDASRDTLWLSPGFENAVDEAGLWVNGGQDVNPNLTREQVIAIRILINDANVWLHHRRYPPAWMWDRANAQHRWEHNIGDARTRSA